MRSAFIGERPWWFRAVLEKSQPQRLNREAMDERSTHCRLSSGEVVVSDSETNHLHVALQLPVICVLCCADPLSIRRCAIPKWCDNYAVGSRAPGKRCECVCRSITDRHRYSASPW